MKTRGPAALIVFALAVGGAALSSRPAYAAAAEIGRLVASKPSAIAVDAGLSKMFVAEQDGIVRIYDTRTYASATVELTCCLVAAVADAATHRVYVSGNGLIVLDAATGVALATVSLAPGTPDALALDSAGERLFVANPPDDSIAVMNTATNSIVGRIPTGDRPSGVAYDDATGIVYVSNAGDQTVQAIDPAGPTTLATVAVTSPASVASGDGEIYVSSDGIVRVLDAATLADVRSVIVGFVPRGLAYNPIAHRLWVANWSSGTVSYIDTSSGTVLGTMPAGTRPGSVVFDAGLGRTYVAVTGSNEVQLLHDVTARIEILSPGEGAMVGPAARIVSGRAPPGAPVTIFAAGVPVGGGLADLSGAFAISTFLGEGAHTVVAAVPYEPYSPARSFTVDLTPPAIALESRTGPGPSGWNRTPVLLRWRCTDALAGVKAGTVEKLLAFDGRDQTSAGTCEDLAGNKATNTVTGISIDQRGPVIGMVRSPAAIAGWNKTSPVSVTFTCVDALSGMTGPTSGSESVAGQTAARDVAFQCSDVAGNVSIRTETVRIDLTAPTAVVDPGLVPVVTRVPGELTRFVAMGIGGTAHDAMSTPSSVEVRIVDENGAEWFLDAPCVASCGEGTMKWRVRVPASLALGSYSVSARATDLAGNRGDWSPAATIVMTSTEDVPLPPLPPLPIG